MHTAPPARRRGINRILASHGYYWTAHWRALRAAALRRDGYHCTVTGCPAPATIVDHIATRPRQTLPAPEDRLDNLRSLCAAHDAQIKEHGGQRGRGGKPAVKGCGADGWPFSLAENLTNMRKTHALLAAMVLALGMAGAPARAGVSVPFTTTIVSGDGSVITPGGSAGLAAAAGQIVTLEGVWTFGAGPNASGDYPLLLNGVNAGWAIRLQVTNGHLYEFTKAAAGYFLRWKAAWLAAGTPAENTVAAAITVSKANPLSIDMPPGTVIATATVTMSPASAKFTGPLLSSDARYKTQGMDIVLARPLTQADVGFHPTTITAVQ